MFTIPELPLRRQFPGDLRKARCDRNRTIVFSPPKMMIERSFDRYKRRCAHLLLYSSEYRPDICLPLFSDPGENCVRRPCVEKRAQPPSKYLGVIRHCSVAPLYTPIQE